MAHGHAGDPTVYVSYRNDLGQPTLVSSEATSAVIQDAPAADVPGIFRELGNTRCTSVSFYRCDNLSISSLKYLPTAVTVVRFHACSFVPLPSGEPVKELPWGILLLDNCSGVEHLQLAGGRLHEVLLTGVTLPSLPTWLGSSGLKSIKLKQCRIGSFDLSLLVGRNIERLTLVECVIDQYRPSGGPIEVMDLELTRVSGAFVPEEFLVSDKLEGVLVREVHLSPGAARRLTILRLRGVSIRE